MAADPNPALRAELNAALTVLTPQIRGLLRVQAGQSAPIATSSSLLEEINRQIATRERKRDEIKTVLANLDTVVASLQTLEADGYPALPQMILSPELYAELQVEVRDVEAAAAVFKAADQIGLDVANVKLTDQTEPQ